jgi:hypothetical protein
MSKKGVAKCGKEILVTPYLVHILTHGEPMSYFGPSGFWNLIDDIVEVVSDAVDAIKEGGEAFVEGLTSEEMSTSDFGDVSREKAKRTKLREKMIKKAVVEERRKLCLECEKSLFCQQKKIGKAIVDFDGESIVRIEYLEIDGALKALSTASALLKDTQAKNSTKETYTVSLPLLTAVVSEVAESALCTYGDHSGINLQDYYEESEDEFVIKLERFAK